MKTSEASPYDGATRYYSGVDHRARLTDDINKGFLELERIHTKGKFVDKCLNAFTAVGGFIGTMAAWKNGNVPASFASSAASIWGSYQLLSKPKNASNLKPTQQFVNEDEWNAHSRAEEVRRAMGNSAPV